MSIYITWLHFSDNLPDQGVLLVSLVSKLGFRITMEGLPSGENR
jgi:hypothetical protein